MGVDLFLERAPSRIFTSRSADLESCDLLLEMESSLAGRPDAALAHLPAHARGGSISSGGSPLVT